MPTELPPLLGEVVPTFADRGCCVVSATDPPGRILGFLDRSRYYFFQVAPQLYSRGWVDPVSDLLPLRKSGSAGNQTQDLWICSQKLWPLDHRGGPSLTKVNVTIFTHTYITLNDQLSRNCFIHAPVRLARTEKTHFIDSFFFDLICLHS
jgi:hypothetical protein